MNEELKKSLTDLIDETLLELEELKKSRFSASEIDIKGPGEGIAGKPSNGDLHAKKAEDKKDGDSKTGEQKNLSDLYKKDYQFARAYDLIRGLILTPVNCNAQSN